VASVAHGDCAPCLFFRPPVGHHLEWRLALGKGWTRRRRCSASSQHFDNAFSWSGTTCQSLWISRFSRARWCVIRSVSKVHLFVEDRTARSAFRDTRRRYTATAGKKCGLIGRVGYDGQTFRTIFATRRGKANDQVHGGRALWLRRPKVLPFREWPPTGRTRAVKTPFGSRRRLVVTMFLSFVAVKSSSSRWYPGAEWIVGWSTLY
jgi:hypothetical protein